MSILSVDNISPIGSGTSVTINNAATLVVNNVNVSGVTTCGSTSKSFTELQIKSSTSGISELRFADTTVNAGYVKYEHSNDVLILATNTSERLRIDSSGNLDIPFANNGTGLRQKIRFVTESNYFDEVAYISVDRTAVSNAPSDLVFGTGELSGGSVNTQERLRIKSNGNLEIGTITDAGNTLRYFDVANYNTGANAGVVERLLTTKSDGTGAAGLDIVKYKAGGAYLINYETIGSNGFIAFSTGENAGSPAERVRINGTGNLKIVTAGKGIDFSANSNLAGMTGEVLDHYEMGTYVPTWSGATNPTTYRNGIDSGTTSNGLSYVRIGNQVTVTGTAFWQSGSSINNARPYMSLPFQARIYSVSGSISNYSLGVTTEIHYLNYDSTTSINMFIQNNAGLHTAFGDNTNGEMYFNITYMTY